MSHYSIINAYYIEARHSKMVSMETGMFTIIFMLISHGDFPFVSEIKAVLDSLRQFKAKKNVTKPEPNSQFFYTCNQISSKTEHTTRKYLLCHDFFRQRRLKM